MAKSPSSPRAILLLPVPSLPWTRSALRTACGTSFSSIFSFLKQPIRGTARPIRLDIGIFLSSADLQILDAGRAQAFSKVQGLIGDIYSLICLVAIQDEIELDLFDGVDPRVFMVKENTKNFDPQSVQRGSYSGPVIDLPTLVASDRAYKTVFAIESERGEGVAREYLRLLGLKNKPLPEIHRVRGGTSIKIVGGSTTQVAEQLYPTTPHHSVIVGGTFDHLHIGHKLLLTATALVTEPESAEETSASHRSITIGITGDELLTKKKFAEQVEGWELRQENTADFLESILIFSKDAKTARQVERIDQPGPNGKLVRANFGSNLTINYVQISDPFGPTITEKDISALVISKETRAGGKAVNDKRVEKGWPALEIFEVDVLDAKPEENADTPSKETFDSKISSTEIRRRIASSQAMN